MLILYVGNMILVFMEAKLVQQAQLDQLGRVAKLDHLAQLGKPTLCGYYNDAGLHTTVLDVAIVRRLHARPPLADIAASPIQC